jgi:hypothetical protein
MPVERLRSPAEQNGEPGGDFAPDLAKWLGSPGKEARGLDSEFFDVVFFESRGTLILISMRFSNPGATT